MSVDKFRICIPVDEAALAEVENMARGEYWEDAIAQAGGRWVREPEITRIENPYYGLVITDGEGNPVLGEDGEPLINHTKVLIFADGWAERDDPS